MKKKMINRMKKILKKRCVMKFFNGKCIIHKKGCTCCKRMINGVSEYTCTVTEEKYRIDGKYTSETTNCVYLVTCGICNMQYIGKTSQTRRKIFVDREANL